MYLVSDSDTEIQNLFFSFYDYHQQITVITSLAIGSSKSMDFTLLHPAFHNSLSCVLSSGLWRIYII